MFSYNVAQIKSLPEKLPSPTMKRSQTPAANAIDGSSKTWREAPPIYTCVVAEEKPADSCGAREREHIAVAEEFHVPLPHSVQKPGAPGHGHVDRHLRSGRISMDHQKSPTPKSNPGTLPHTHRGERSRIRQKRPQIRSKSNLYPRRCKLPLENQT